jgi:hypothetical protein
MMNLSSHLTFKVNPNAISTLAKNSFWKCILGSVFTFILSCKSAPPQTTPSPLQVLPQSALLSPVKADEILISQQIKLIEDAFARRHCESVVEHHQRLNSIAAGDKTLPLSTILAIKYCKAFLNPSLDVAMKEAIETIETAQKELTPNWNAITLESLKAALYKVTNQKSNLLISKNKQRVLAQWYADLTVQIDAERFALATGTDTYTVAQKDQLNQILKAWPESKNLIQVLSEIDQFSAQLPATADKQPVIDFRNAVVLSLDEKFAVESSLIERTLLEGNVGQAQALAQSAKKTFPLSNYIARIDALFSNQKTDVLTTSNAPTSVKPLPLAIDAVSPIVDTELVFISAKKSLDEGQPENAVTAIDAVPKANLNEKLNRLRKEAVESSVRKTRLRVRNLFNQANATKDPSARSKLINECTSVLTELLKKFPDAPGRQSIERNIRNLQLEAKEPIK